MLAQRFAADEFASFGVAAIPQGGLAVASPLAKSLDTSVISCPAARISSPMSRTLAIGAVAGWTPIERLSAEIILTLDVSEQQVAEAAASARLRLSALCEDLDPAAFASRCAGAWLILVDDCVATGASMITACDLLREHGAERVVAATPLISAYGLGQLSGVADEVVFLHCSEEPNFSISGLYRT